jgi:hypothetical protein
MENSYLSTGSPVPFECFGDLTLVYPMTIGNLGTVEAYLLAKPNLLKKRLVKLNVPDRYMHVFESVTSKQVKKRRSYTFEDLNDFLLTLEGLILSLWLELRGQKTFKECKTEVTSWDTEKTSEFVVARDIISGFDWRAIREWKGISFWGEDEKEGKSKRQNWKWLVRQICEALTGVVPSDVADWTFYQLRLMSDSEQSVRSGGFKMTIEQWRSMSEERTYQILA